MQPPACSATSTAVRPVVDQARGQHGDAARDKHGGAGGLLLILGLAAGIYVLSPGARHFYRHGYLPRVGR